MTRGEDVPLPRELEIKLAGESEAIARALRAESVRSVTAGRVRVRQLQSVYFDTPEGHLRDLGLGLRLRSQGRRWIQTLKRERGVVSGAHERDELEHFVGTLSPDFALYDGTPFEQVFADAALRARVGPMFGTRFRRSVRILAPPGARIEAAFDLGVVEAGDRQEPLCELELELLEGDPEALFALAARLCAEHPLRIENRSKAERGYALLSGLVPAPVKARVPHLTAELLPDEAFTSVAGECLRHLQANTQGLIEGADPEYVHQARVALRRLRAAIAMFQPMVQCPQLQACDEELRCLSQGLGVARDWDVFCLETLPCVPDRLDVGDGKQRLADQAAARRVSADRHAQALVAGPRFTVFMLELAGMMQARPWRGVAKEASPEDIDTGDTIAFARIVLERAWRRARKRARDVDESSPESYHALRIALKKLRYGGEYFAQLFPRKATRPFLSVLSDLQEHLGSLNDAATALRLAEILRPEIDDPDVRELLGVLRGYFAGRMDAAIRPLEKSWRQLRTSAPFWR